MKSCLALCCSMCSSDVTCLIEYEGVLSDRTFGGVK